MFVITNDHCYGLSYHGTKAFDRSSLKIVIYIRRIRIIIANENLLSVHILFMSLTNVKIGL